MVLSIKKNDKKKFSQNESLIFSRFHFHHTDFFDTEWESKTEALTVMLENNLKIIELSNVFG